MKPVLCLIFTGDLSPKDAESMKGF